MPKILESVSLPGRSPAKLTEILNPGAKYSVRIADLCVYELNRLEPYKIEIKFNDGTRKQIDLASILYGGLFEPLRNPELFMHVRLNEEVATIEWPNSADFDPETLYNWEHYKDELTERAKKWKYAQTEKI